MPGPDAAIIRAVVRADFEQWLPLWHGYNAFYGRAGDTTLPADITNMTWARFFDAYEPVRALVAERDGRLVGLAHYLFHRTTIGIEPTCYLQDLFTVQEQRGTGVGPVSYTHLDVYKRQRWENQPLLDDPQVRTWSCMSIRMSRR